MEKRLLNLTIAAMIVTIIFGFTGSFIFALARLFFKGENKFHESLIILLFGFIVSGRIYNVIFY